MGGGGTSGRRGGSERERKLTIAAACSSRFQNTASGAVRGYKLFPRMNNNVNVSRQAGTYLRVESATSSQCFSTI